MLRHGTQITVLAVADDFWSLNVFCQKAGFFNGLPLFGSSIYRQGSGRAFLATAGWSPNNEQSTTRIKAGVGIGDGGRRPSCCWDGTRCGAVTYTPNLCDERQAALAGLLISNADLGAPRRGGARLEA